MSSEFDLGGGKLGHLGLATGEMEGHGAGVAAVVEGAEEFGEVRFDRTRGGEELIETVDEEGEDGGHLLI